MTGQKVWLKHNGEVAVVSDNSDNDIIYVIAGDMEIPVFADDVITETPELIPGKKSHEEKKFESAPNETGIESGGIEIVFQPLFNDDEITEFKIYFITPPIKIDKVKYAFYEGDNLFFNHSFSPLSGEVVFLHTLEFDQLNESPEIELQVQTGNSTFHKYIKIKPKNFFNKLGFVPQLSMDAFVFSIEFVPKEEVKHVQEKFEINATQLKHSMQRKEDKKSAYSHSAERVVDLHIEKIAKDFKSLSNSEIIEIQLNYFQRALNAALRSHLNHMFVIHGLGKGVLKNKIAEILKTYPGIKSYNNDYHPLFGWGATEIIFK